MLDIALRASTKAATSRRTPGRRPSRETPLQRFVRVCYYFLLYF